MILSAKEFKSRKGMVITKHPLATKVGLEILKKGGNAIDAAIASAFAIGVVEPHMSGLGGGSWIVIRLSNGEDYYIDGSPKVPSRVPYFELEEGIGDMYGWKKVKGDANLLGYTSIIVPGTFSALKLVIENFCKLSLEELIEPSIKLAEEGFYITPSFSLALIQEYEKIINFEETSRIFLKNKRYPLKPCFQEPLSPADKLVQKDLAETLKILRKTGEFYKGEIANRIADEIERKGGTLSYSDLTQYKAKLSRAQKGYYKDAEILTTISHGGATLIQLLNILEGFDLAELKHNSLKYIILLAKSMKLAFRERYTKLADPEKEKVDLNYLLSKSYAEELRKNIDLDFNLKPNPDYSCTTHICTCDYEGNLVSLTQSLGMLFGSKVTIMGLLMNDGYMWFDPTGKSISRILPHKLPLGAATPTIVKFKGGYLSIGAPGGRRIIGAVLQCILNILEFNMRPQKALEKPRIDHSTEELIIDERLKVPNKGFKVRVVKEDLASFNFASPIAILKDNKGIMYSGVDPYKFDNSVGFL